MQIMKINLGGIIGAWLILCLSCISCQGQSVDDLIQSQQEKLKDQQGQVQDILEEIEQLKLQKIRESLRKYLPKDAGKHEIIEHTAMTISYNEDHEQANWVMHIIPKDVITGTATRSNDFRPDPKVSTGSADVEDYWDSGYDRGHMAPSADFRWSKNALSESYYYSNMSPQNHDLNRDAWAKLENQIREWVVDNDELIIITGPVLHPELPKIQQGSYRVSIPEAYYKIIVDLTDPEIKAISFLFPNKNVKYEPEKYVVTIDSIEQLTGINFFPNLAQAETLEKTADLSAWQITSTALSKAPGFRYDLDHVPTKQASYFIGTECNVCGKVVGTRYNKQTETKITYINFDEPYPNSPFTAVIFGKDRIHFTYEPEIYLRDKLICIRGKVQLYKGKPQIVATSEAQISLYQPAGN